MRCDYCSQALTVCKECGAKFKLNTTIKHIALESGTQLHYCKKHRNFRFANKIYWIDKAMAIR